MDTAGQDGKRTFDNYTNLVSQAFLAKILSDMFSDLIVRDEFGELPEFRAFSESLLARVDQQAEHKETLSFAHWYEPEGETKFHFYDDNAEKRATLESQVRFIIECEGIRAIFPIRIAAQLHGFTKRSSWDDVEVTFEIQDGVNVRYYGRHVEMTFIERLS